MPSSIQGYVIANNKQEKTLAVDILENISKLEVYLNSLNYLYSLRKSADYYLLTIEELKKEKGNPIMLNAARINLQKSKELLDKQIAELNLKSEYMSAEEIKNYTLENSKYAYALLTEAKKLVEEHISRMPEETAARELMKNIAEINAGVALANAYNEYKEGSISRINLYLVAAVSLVPVGGSVLKNVLKNRSKIAAVEKVLSIKPSEEVIGAVDDFVKKIPEDVSKNLANARKSIPYKSDNIFSALSHADGAIKEISERYPNINSVMNNASVYVLDKSKTWLLNGINRKVGDVGLEIYFNAMRKIADKGYVARITQVGDEIVILGPKGMQSEIQKALLESSEEIFKKYGLKDVYRIKEKCAQASILEAEIIIKNGKVFYKVGGKEMPFNVERLINDVELNHSLSGISESSRRKILGFVEKLEPKSLPASSIPKSDSTNAMKVIIEFKDKGMQKALKEIAEKNGKAVHQAATNSIGPSTVNQLGYINADYITASAVDELAKAGKITKKEAEQILHSGALTYSLEGPSAKSLISRLNGTTIDAKIGGEMVKLSFYAGTPKHVEEMAAAHLLSKIGIKGEAVNKILHATDNINKTIAKLHLQGENLPPWARETLSVIYSYIY
ncbi:MAG: hypothetical protein N3G76_02325 [Candidatus Micrarchaeota archaeon]|nr:hypothetical protein [Candidatus Micrarchaeota archaeon]